MTRQRVYLDYNASTPLLPEARAAMVAALDNDANPSSVHREGKAARRLVEDARRSVAKLAGAEPANVVFTSGASEAASMLLTHDWRMGRSSMRVSHLYVCATEHTCVLSGGSMRRDEISEIGVGRNGVVDLELLDRALANHDHECGLPLVAVQAANNESGVLQPIAEIAVMAHARRAVFVVDAVQAAGRIPIDISDKCGDFLIFSSHKIGGPKGAGAVAAKSTLMMPRPLVTGGGQEKGHRAGTENVAAIAGFGAAAEIAHAKLACTDALRQMRDTIEQFVVDLEPQATIVGAAAERLCNTVLFSLPGMKAETAQIALDLAGFSVSAGSACSSGKVGPSHVLKAMGHEGDAGALRVSIGWATREDDLSLFRAALADHLSRRSAADAAA